MSSTPTEQPDRLALDVAEPASRKKVISWALWDWGTQPVSTIVITFVFAVYLASKSFGSGNGPTQAVTTATTIAGIVVALLAPALGQNSDRRGHTVRDLKWMTWGLAGLTAVLFVVKAQPSFLLLGVFLYGVIFAVNEIAAVNNNALLNSVAQGHNVGRLSGFGWGMGYLGGIVSLLLFNFAIIADNSWFGVPSDDGLDIRLAMVACAVWIVLFTLPTFLNLKDKPPSGPVPQNPWRDRRPGWLWAIIGPIGFTYRELFRSITRLWRTHRQTALFLIASVLFRDALGAIFTVGGIIAAVTFGFTPGEVIMFGAAANVLAGVATIGFGLLDDKIGPKRVILFSLGALALLATVIFALASRGPIIFWTAGLGLTLFVGPAQAASRSYLARLTPEGQSGEMFGLYATTGRAVSWLSMGLFTVFVSVGKAITGAEETQHWGILGIIIVLIAGFFAMLPIKETKRNDP